MNELVYIARADSDVLQEKFQEAGIPFVVKDGPYDYELLKDATAMVPGKLPVTERELDAAAGLRVISKYGVGLDRIDVAACTARRILVCNTPTINYVSVAEHAVMLMMTAAKQVVLYNNHLQTEPEKWRRKDIPRGIELHSKAVAIIGLGRIGRYAAQLAHGLGMRVLGYDPFVDPASQPDYVRTGGSLTEVISEADFVSIHVAGNEQTRGMISAEVIAHMKPTAVLVNTTRGFVVDESALIEALDANRIAGAALDVFTEEPLRAGHPLLGRDNVIITPHCAANTVDAHFRAEIGTAENIRQALNGERPETAVN